MAAVRLINRSEYKSAFEPQKFKSNHSSHWSVGPDQSRIRISGFYSSRCSASAPRLSPPEAASFDQLFSGCVMLDPALPTDLANIFCFVVLGRPPAK